MFRSKINMGGTAADCFLNDAFVGKVKKNNGFWHFTDAAGSSRNLCPAADHSMVERIQGYKPIAKHTPVLLGVALQSLRAELTASVTA